MRELWNSRAASTRLLIKLGDEVVLSAHFYTKKALQKIIGYCFFQITVSCFLGFQCFDSAKSI